MGDDPLVNALEKMFSDVNEWTGSATDLLKKLEQYHDNQTKFDHWPKNPAYLAKRLKELQPLLVEVQIEVKFVPGHSKGRKLSLRNLAAKTPS